MRFFIRILCRGAWWCLRIDIVMLKTVSHQKHHKYWQRFLLPGEKPLHMFGISRLFIVVFWVGPGLIATAAAAWVLIVLSVPLGAILMVVPASFFLAAILYRYFTHYVITDKRAMSRAGIIHKKFITVDLKSVTDITVRESFLERVLVGTAMIDLNTAGSDRVELVLKHVRKPFALRRYIYKHQQILSDLTYGGQ